MFGTRNATQDRSREILARDFSPYPVWPTTMRTAMRDGRLVGTAVDGSRKVGSVWLYKAVPMSPVVDAKTTTDIEDAAAPLQAAFRELAAMIPVGMKRRSTSLSKYREFHLLLVNVPQRYRPPADHPLKDQLLRDFGDTVVDRRLLLFGVRLQNSWTGGATSDSWREVVNSAIESTVEQLVGTDGVSLADFQRDFRAVDSALSRAGLERATGSEIAFANSWWNHGRSADLAYIPHSDHLHCFESVRAGQDAKRHLDDGHSCDEWEQEPNPDEWAMTFTSVSNFNFEWARDTATSPNAAWVCQLLNLDTLAVSIRGRVEPSVVTREEIRRQRTEVIRDINERANQGKLERAEQQEQLGQLNQVEDYYATSAPPATLVEVSVLAALNGRVDDLEGGHYSGAIQLAPMENRQAAALAETMLCSGARANPHVHDLPSQVVSYAGAGSLSSVGDTDGALLGLTETDRQPAYFSPSVTSRADAAPVSLVVGQTRSGKSVLAQWLAYQFAEIPNRHGQGTPVVFVNPKPDQDLSPAALAARGRVMDLDSLSRADGIVDPIRFGSSEVGITMASSLLSTLNPWGSQALMQEYEVDMLRALRFGVEHGARGTGEALIIAQQGIGDSLPPGMVDKVLMLARNEPLAKAMIGLDPQGESMKAAEGLTLIQSGSKSFDVGDPNATDMVSKLKRALVRNLVYGAQTALAHRQGVVMFDEAWVFLEGGRAEIDRLGRTAASMEVQAIMFTQKVSDAVNAGLGNYVSRMITLAIEDEDEAKAALELMRWGEAGPAVLRRIRAKARIGQAHNFNSLRALIDPVTRRAVRGSVAYYNDLGGRVVPVEIRIPEWFMTLASTNPDDIARRLAQQAAHAE